MKQNKSYAEIQQETAKKIKWNWEKLCDLVEYARNAPASYGITVILERFMEKQLKDGTE